MPALDELINESEVKPGIEPGLEPGQEVLTVEEPSRVNEFLSKIVKAQTGPGEVSQYKDHPLNFSKSDGLARVIRGLTGIIGNLDLAIIDVAMGFLEFSKERKGGNVNDVYGGGGFPS